MEQEGIRSAMPILKWAFSEAAILFLRAMKPAKKWFERLTKKHGKGKALSILAHKLGRAVYFIAEEPGAIRYAEVLEI